MEKEEIEKAAARLGVEKKALKWRVLEGVGILAIILAWVFVFLAVLFLLYLFLRSLNTYPHVRSPVVPKNRFLAALILFAQMSEAADYGVFSRVQLLQLANS
ncbi:MAG: hypothetical protein ACXADX_13970 [Candidatus Hodarchaeales archaeon]|jgi:hypothetical protein